MYYILQYIQYICDSMYFVRAAAARTKRKKKKYGIWNAAMVYVYLF